MPYLTESKLARRHSIPVSLSLTLLKKTDWILLSTVRLTSTMSLSYRFLQLQLVDITIEGTTASEAEGGLLCLVTQPTLINPSLGIAYVAIYQDYNVKTDPKDLTFVGTQHDIVIIEDTGIAARDISQPELILEDAASYSYILVNNTSNADLRLAVNGEATVNV
jgi:hypothetical protein